MSVTSQPFGAQVHEVDRRDIADTPIEYDDPDLRCYALTAYASPEAKQVAYDVPATPDLYTGFLIRAPWSGTQYIKSMRALIDNQKVVHHLLLLRQHRTGSEGIVPNGTGIHNDADMLYAWAPGASDLWLGREVGMEMPEGSLLMMENHYNNRGGAPAPDKSGVEVCVTPRKPKNVAALSYVGTDLIFGASARGTCTHESREPVHLIMAFPHMHTKGVHMKVDWTRANGTRSTLHDQPFDASSQRQFLYRDVVLQPGDKLTTSCTFSGPSVFGKGSADEMCIFFSLHYPAGALAKKSLFQALHGPNTCID
ncbi:MAG: hypothetical protein ABW252_04770 [Polyangiales bacterium]